MGRFSGKTCRLGVMFSLTFGFFIVELVFGYMTHSMALIADSFHMLSDVLALVIAFSCMKISRKNASSKNTFGWVRAEVLGALINAVFLMALCFSIIVEALKRLVEPEKIEDPLHILIVGVLGLIINIVGIAMFHGHSSVHGHSHARPVPLDLPRDNDSPPPETYRQNNVKSSANNRSSKQNSDDQEDNSDLSVENLGPIISGAHNISVLLDTQMNLPHSSDDDFENLGRKSSKPVHEKAVFLNNNRSKNSETNYNKNSNHVTDKLGNDMINGKLNDKEPLKSKESQETKNHAHAAGGQLNMHGVFLHILGDAFGSVIVVVNAVICMYTTNEDLPKYLDPSLSLVIAAIITTTTLPLLKESAMILLQTVPTHLNVQDLKSKLLKSIDGVLAVHEFHVWRLAGNKIIATAHIRCRNPEHYMKIAEQVKEFFHREGIHSTTIQPEFMEVSQAADLSGDVCVIECPKASLCAPSKCCTIDAENALKADGSLDRVSVVRSVGSDLQHAHNLTPSIAGGRNSARNSPQNDIRSARSADNLVVLKT